MKTWLIIPFLIAGCGVVNEKEAPPPLLNVRKETKANCVFPDAKLLTNKRDVTQALVDSAVNCLNQNITKAFDQIQGKKNGEITIEEIKILHEKRIIEIDIEQVEIWDFVAELAAFFHPEGRPAINKETTDKIIHWLNSNSHYWIKAMKTDWGPEKEHQWIYSPEIITALNTLIELISNDYRLPLSRIFTLIDKGEKIKSFNKNKEYKKAEYKEKAQALWTLKSFFLPDIYSQENTPDLSSLAIKKALKLGLDLYQNSHASTEWTLDESAPKSIPSNLPNEYEQWSRLVVQYFSENTFAEIQLDDLKGALRRLLSKYDQGITELVPDLLRFSQRLSPKNQIHNGIHPIALVRLLKLAPLVAEDMLIAAEAYRHCKKAAECKSTFREMLKNPVLKHLALKSGYGWNNFESTEISKYKRLDLPMYWSNIPGNLIKKRVLAELFKTFADENGLLRLSAEHEEDLEQTLDLAYTFLRFASIKTTSDDKKENEIQMPKPVIVKPGPLTKIMGLVGDSWVKEEGNGDGFLNGDEFYSIIELYDQIQNVGNSSNSMSMSTNVAQYYLYSPATNSNYYQFPIYGRRNYIESLQFATFLPHIQNVLQKINKSVTESLYHALIGRNENPKPKTVYSAKWDGSSTNIMSSVLYHYVDRSAGLAPAAVMVMVDRLMLRCDTNEDEKLDWLELDCVMPLLLEAGLQTISSELVSLDAPVHDGAKLLLDILKMKGVPFALAKILAVNGSVTTFNLNIDFKELVDHVDQVLTGNWENIARFISAQEDEQELTPETLSYWVYEAKKRYGKCDINKNDSLQGKEEWVCFTEQTFGSIVDTLAQISKVSSSLIEQIKDKKEMQTLKLGLILGTQTEEVLNKLMKDLGVHSEPHKILTLLENVIHRAEKNKLNDKDDQL